MAYFKKKEVALEMRKAGMSYGQIKGVLKISKSTLSYWLSEYPLSKERIKELRNNNQQRIERFRNTMRLKREKRLKLIYNRQKNHLLPLTKKELLLGGLFLYWGEGSKSHLTDLSLANTDPSIIKYFVLWLSKLLKFPKERLNVQLHLYSDMDIVNEINFWSAFLKINKSQFNKPYIKKSSLQNINHKGGFGHGTCCVTAGNARLSEIIRMSLKAISEIY